MGLVRKLLKKGVSQTDLNKNNFKLRNKHDNFFYFKNSYLGLFLTKIGNKYYFTGVDQNSINIKYQLINE